MDAIIGPAAAGLQAIPPWAWLAVALVLVAQRLVARLGMWPYALFALPGTLAHEGAHWLVARLLLAQPRFPSLWPRRTAGGWRLGSVAFVAPWWRAAPIALAPVALLPVSLAWVAWFLVPADGAVAVLHAWIAGTLLNAALPSRTDLRLAAPLLALLAAAAIGWLAVASSPA